MAFDACLSYGVRDKENGLPRRYRQLKGLEPETDGRNRKLIWMEPEEGESHTLRGLYEPRKRQREESMEPDSTKIRQQKERQENKQEPSGSKIKITTVVPTTPFFKKDGNTTKYVQEGRWKYRKEHIGPDPEQSRSKHFHSSERKQWTSDTGAKEELSQICALKGKAN